MANPFSTATKSLHEQAIESLIQATNAADKNEQDRVKMHVQQAKMFAELTARKMRAMGMHRQADEYVKHLNEHINRVWVIAQRRHSDDRQGLIQKAKDTRLKMRKAADACKCDTKKAACKCGYMDKDMKDVKKGLINPYVGESPARREYMQTGTVKPTWGLGSVKPDPKHHYKMIHDLTPAQQDEIQQKFPQGDHARYAYPVHKDSGELAHAQRIALAPGQVVQAQRAALKEIKPEHKKGAFVQIHAPGNAVHGKKGVVHGPNPNVPGKIKVQIGHTEHHSVYVEPHQVRISRPMTKIEKAIQTVFNIRKVFMK